MPSAAPSRTCGPTRTGSHVRSIRSAASALGLVSVLVLSAVGAGPSQASVGPVDSARPSASTVPADGTAAIRAYVTQVYEDLFGRAPDAGGLATWTAQLAAGVPYAAVANAITSSTEYRSRLIAGAYTRYLGRAPDAGGVQFWLGQMAGGRQIEQIEAGFVASQEFYERGGGTDRGWVTLLYRTVLDRAPSTAEVDWWAGAIGRGMNRGAVALGFLYSTEHLVTVVDGYYVDLLHRHIDPSGSATWVGLIQSGSRDEEIIAAIVSSYEYYLPILEDDPPQRVSVNVSFTPQTCVDGQLVGGSVGWQLPLDTGIYRVSLGRNSTMVSDAPVDDLPPGEYALRVVTLAGYELDAPHAIELGGGGYDIPLTIAAYPDACPEPPVSSLISRAADGGPANNGSSSARVSRDGAWVAYSSLATNLVPGGTGTTWDLWLTVVTDVRSGATTVVSAAPDGTPANHNSEGLPSISADGRWVAYTSRASNLVPGDTNGAIDVFLWDRETRATTWVSANETALMIGEGSGSPSISADGRWVAFTSLVPDLVPGDTNESADVFLWDRISGQTTLVSAAPGSLPANGSSSAASISGDGRWVAFTSAATNLTADPISGWGVDNIYVWDRVTGATVQVSRGMDGQAADQPSASAAISDDGSVVAYVSQARNLVPGSRGLGADIFVTDLRSGSTTLVTATPDGLPADHEPNGYLRPAISGDGRWVAYGTAGANLVPGPPDRSGNIYVWDRLRRLTWRVTAAFDGGPANDQSAAPSVSVNGRWVAYTSRATNLVSEPTSQVDVYLADLALP